MSEQSYEDRIRSQIEQYANTINMHDLPEIFHVWSHEYIGPGMKQVFGTSSIDEAYGLAYIDAAKHPEHTGRLLSIGCGDGAVEIRVAKYLIANGFNDFEFVCADLSPILLGHLKKAVAAEGLTKHFTPVEADLNKIQIPGNFDVMMANHALHHIEGLESLFEYSCQNLSPSGIFATCDMIGRNGHRRWPETAAVLSALWPALSVKKRYHSLLQRVNDTFLDHDCSKEGFEGIRAQDILPLMLKYLKPYKFFATGGFVDVIVDRGFGHAYDAKSPEDVSFIRFLADMNEVMLDSGVVKPTWVMAYFTKDDRGEKYYRDRNARSSVRIAETHPSWTRFYKEPNHT
ncbi:class I SAM-dependent methyltransferase [Methylorubrum extorquens]|uniref:class I SAM-dependent methyltransferase n=1 Tax=Methylorubrum extorquens TaxID=408 RepID=UPI0020A10DC8|nr:class I SAM-dependent methyltransferase [Methylorubrum extorquens]MCP1538103.1 SAM-dependent methyltransferase [Methylorubrum extorquens]